MTFFVCNLLDENIHFVKKTPTAKMAPLLTCYWLYQLTG